MKWARRILITGALLLVISYVLGSIDYRRVRNNERPLFVVFWSGFFDGGTQVGLGFGYQVVSNHGCKYANEHKKPDEATYWTEGPELKFWFFPFLDKSELKFSSLKRAS